MEQQLRQMIAELLEDPNMIKMVSLDTDLILDVGLDSLTMVKLLLRTEDEFDIEIDYENLDINSLRSLRCFCEYIKACRPYEGISKR